MAENVVYRARRACTLFSVARSALSYQGRKKLTEGTTRY
jgi:hypothetical protein